MKGIDMICVRSERKREREEEGRERRKAKREVRESLQRTGETETDER